jgi:hypothetical protein
MNRGVFRRSISYVNNRGLKTRRSGTRGGKGALIRISAPLRYVKITGPPAVDAYFDTVHAGLGNREQVFTLLERAVQERDPYVPDFGVNSIFRGYGNEPRVQRLLRQMG